MSRRLRRAAACAVVLAAAGGLPLAARLPPARATATFPPLPALHVATLSSGGRAQIVDAYGRQVILRGVNLTGAEDDYYAGSVSPDGLSFDPAPFWPVDPAAYQGTCPANSHLVTEPPVCEVQAGQPEFSQSAADGSQNDLAQIRALGLDVVRLPVNWSLLEPTPGRYSATYLDRLAQIVGWARQQEIYVLLDMHEDDYSRFTPASYPTQVPPLLTTTQQSGGHADGAPPWAVVTDGEPPLAPGGQGPLNAYVEAAFTSFWDNRVPVDAAGHALPAGAAPGAGLQDHYIGAMAALAARFKGDSTVAGYEFMNEPLPGYAAAPGGFDQQFLFPFYRRVIDALTGAGDGVPCPPSVFYPAACGYRDLGVHDRQLMFFEPVATRNLTDVAPGVSAPFSSYPDLVYAPHAYTHVFTADTQDPTGTASQAYPPGYDYAMVTADTEARVLGAALFIGEYGNANSQDARILASEITAQEDFQAGSTLWAWKGNCGPGQTAAQCEPGLWSVYYADPATSPAENLGPIQSRVKYLSRSYPRAVAGSLIGFRYTPDTRQLQLGASATGPVAAGDADHETVVYVPAGASIGPPRVAVTGAARLDRIAARPDGSWLVLIRPTSAGGYYVTVG